MFSAMRFAAIFFVFLTCTGMKLILKDGNFIEITKYKIRSGRVYFEKQGKAYYFPEYMVDRESTKRLLELESNKISLFKSYTAVSGRVMYYSDDILKSKDKTKKDVEQKTGTAVKVETRKDPSPFFIELGSETDRDESFMDRLKRKGVMFKIEIPVTDK